MSISRRKFLRNASAVAGAATLSAVLPSVAAAAPAPTTYDYEADIVILGYGGAGACAAIEAADAGSSVILLEKQQAATHYSNSRMSGGIYHTTFPEYDKEALKQYARAMFSGDNIPWKLEGEEDPVISDGLAQAWADYIPGLSAWLKSLDPRFNNTRGSSVNDKAAFPEFPGAAASGYTVTSCSFTGYIRSITPTKDKPYLEKENGEAYYAVLHKAITDRASKIQIMYETPATDLIMNTAGEVIGAVASSRGRTINVKAKKAVILTTGGYEYNLEMRRGFCEGQGVEGWAFYGTTHNTGDGIAMGMRAGAGLAKAGKAASRFIGAAPVRAHGLKIGFITPAVGRPNAIMVNNVGNRFIAETMITDDPSRYFSYKEAVRFNISNLHYENNPSWFIMDQTHMDSAPLTNMELAVAGYDYLPWSRDNQDAVRRGWIMKANTIEELAGLIQKHPENKNQLVTQNLVNAVNRWNQLCAQGSDTDLNRRTATLGPVSKAPFYALPLYAGGPNTKGGLMCNADRKVLMWGGKPIPRLYSAGEMTSALKFVYQGGGNITETMVMGRVAGKNASKETPLR